MKKTIVSMAAAAMLLAGAGDAAAQERSSARGFLLGAHLNASAIQLDEDEGTDAENGIGGGAVLGYGFSERIALFLRLNGAGISGDSENGEDATLTLASLDLGGRYSFGSTAAALRPYVELGFSGTGLGFETTIGTQTGDLVFAGTSIFGSAGLEYFFTRKAALDVGLTLGKGRFTTVTFEDESEDLPEAVDFTTSRIIIGINFRP